MEGIYILFIFVPRHDVWSGFRVPFPGGSFLRDVLLRKCFCSFSFTQEGIRVHALWAVKIQFFCVEAFMLRSFFYSATSNHENRSLSVFLFYVPQPELWTVK